MNIQTLPDPVDTYQVAKVLLSAIFGAFVASSLTGCGVKVGEAGNFVLGTRSFLEEVNNGKEEGEPMDSYTDAEKRKLSALVNTQTRRY